MWSFAVCKTISCKAGRNLFSIAMWGWQSCAWVKCGACHRVMKRFWGGGGDPWWEHCVGRHLLPGWMHQLANYRLCVGKATFWQERERTLMPLACHWWGWIKGGNVCLRGHESNSCGDAYESWSLTMGWALLISVDWGGQMWLPLSWGDSDYPWLFWACCRFGNPHLFISLWVMCSG